MPTEKITDGVSQGWYTEVSWRRAPDGDDRGSAEGHVQLATVNSFSPFEFPEREQDGAWEAGERFDGWRVTLDEAGIDRLIKALHKAKNQAFGSSRAERADAAARAYEAAIKDGVNPHKARRDAWASAGYSEAEIAAFERTLTGDAMYACGGLVSSGETVTLTPAPEVTVESDATAAARLDTDRYRDVRKGNR